MLFVLNLNFLNHFDMLILKDKLKKLKKYNFNIFLNKNQLLS
jgi:hypothetical protein